MPYTRGQAQGPFRSKAQMQQLFPTKKALQSLFLENAEQRQNEMGEQSQPNGHKALRVDI